MNNLVVSITGRRFTCFAYHYPGALGRLFAKLTQNAQPAQPSEAGSAEARHSGQGTH